MKQSFTPLGSLKRLLLSLMLLMALPALAFESGGIFYDLTDYDEASGKYLGVAVVSAPNEESKYAGEVVIPATVDYEGETYNVTKITDYAFRSCNELKTIELPNTITYVGRSAFAECASLKAITLPESVTYLGSYAFHYCGAMTSVEILGELKTIGEFTFYCCGSLKSIKLPDSITSIQNDAFGSCGQLSSINVPASLTSLGNYAFNSCASLTSLVLPSSLTSIGSNAFVNCTSLISVNIPESLISIEGNTFRECHALASVEIPNSVTTIGDAAFLGCNSLASVVIPESVKSIGTEAFGWCNNLRVFTVKAKDITLANIFGDYGYQPCYIIAPVGLDCTALNCNVRTYDPETTVFMEDGTVLTDNGKTLFFVHVEPGSSYAIPEGVTKVLCGSIDTAPAAVIGLESLTIPSTIEEIEPNTFQYAEIGKVNFTDWNKWYSNVKLGNLYSNPYWNSKPYVGGVVMTTPELKEGMTEIPDYVNFGLAFSGVVKLPSTIKRIGAYAFAGKEGLSYLPAGPSYEEPEYTSIILPEGLEEIGESAFDGARKLKYEFIPKSVVSIGDNAFRNCSGLLALVICPQNVSLGIDCFSGCNPDFIFVAESFDASPYEYLNPDKLVRFDPNGVSILPDGSILTDYGKTLFYASIGTSEEYSIPDGVENILKDTFRELRNGSWISTGEYRTPRLKSLTLPASIKHIEADAFESGEIERVNFIDWNAWYSNVKLDNLQANPYWNSKPYVGGVVMTTPELKEGMTEIPDYVGYGLRFKDEIELPTTIKRVGAYAFYNNKELYSVILPAGLEEIGESAFEGCELLENPAFPAGLKKIEDGAYKDCTSITEIVLPEGLTMLGEMTSLEKETDEWGNTMPVNIKGVFEGCNSLEKAVLVSEIDYLDDNLFKGCEKLYKVFLPLQLKTIGDYTFAKCLALDEITLPASLESIGNWAFTGQCDDNGFWDATSGTLSQLVIPDNVKSIGEHAFYYQNIGSLTLGKGLEVIPTEAFSNNPLKVINFSDGLKEIGNRAFAYDGGDLGAVILPSTVTTIGSGAFNSTYVSELSIPDGVMVLAGDETCGRPSKLTLGSGIKEIAADAFNFERLYTIRLKAHMPPSLDEALKISEAQNDRLTLIVNEGRHDTYNTNARWKQIDRIIEEGQSDVIIYMTGDYPLSEEIRVTTGLMPSSVTKMKVVGPLTEKDLRIIKENMVSLTSLDMSEVSNVTAIPEHQFDGSLLTDIILPSNLESIGIWAFNYCRLLKLDDLPESIKRIEGGAFAACPNITLSKLPASLEYLGDLAFDGCIGLREMVAGGNLSEIGNSAFQNCALLETVDLSASPLTRIPDNAFAGCHELDQVILPETVVELGSNSFSGTALRNIDFAAGVSSIGYGAFSDNRRLVSATLPESVKEVNSGIFGNCPRLIAVSMPSATVQVGGGILDNDRKLANISCAAVEAPYTESGAFNGVRTRYVALTVPTLSFRSYLNEPGWGKFENIKNRIPVEIDKGVDVTNVSEDEYQDMLAEDALEEAQEAAAEQNGEISRTRAERRAVARAATIQNFAALFDGAQIQSGDEINGMRVFINPQEDVKITSILFNGEELLPSYDGHSVLLPKGSNGTLQIRTDYVEKDPVEGAVDAVVSEELNVVIEGSDIVVVGVAAGTQVGLFGLDGKAYFNGVSNGSDLRISVASGVYVLKAGNAVKKVIIR